jgi:hypothetical protein
VLTEPHASLGPGVEVGLHVDGAASPLLLANRPELREVAGALNRGGVVALALENFVGSAVGLDSALSRSARGRVVIAEVLDDVVLNQRVGGPAVDGKVRVAVGVVLAGVGDGATEYVSDVLYPSGDEELTGRFRASSPFHRRSCRRSSS